MPGPGAVGRQSASGGLPAAARRSRGRCIRRPGLLPHPLTTGDALELAVCDVLANYYDPANRRAALIQQAARELSDEIKRFGRTVFDVGQQYVTTYSAASLAATKLMGQMVRNAADGFSATRASAGKDPLDVVHAMMEGLSDAQRKNALLMTQGIVVGERLATAIEVAVGLLRVRPR